MTDKYAMRAEPIAVAPPKQGIFVFGSNLAGRHGKGAALDAKRYFGAIQGQGIGLQGKSYAIPTKDENLRRLSLLEIAIHVDDFLDFAREHPEMRFAVTKIGCGWAGYSPSDIAILFHDVPDNVELPVEFRRVLA